MFNFRFSNLVADAKISGSSNLTGFFMFLKPTRNSRLYYLD